MGLVAECSFAMNLLPILVLAMHLRLFYALKISEDQSGNGLQAMRGRINYKEIMMDPLEVDLVLKIVKGRTSYLEWGSGGSTLNFPQFISGKVVSIEHDKEWCDNMPVSLAKKNIRNVNLYCIRTIGTNKDEGTYATFKPYIDKINTLNESTWDLVLIDGRARVAASIRALSYIRSESAVIVHDFERVLRSGSASYSGMLEYYDVIERIGKSMNVNTGARGIARLQRKKEYDYLEGDHDEVQKILDETIPPAYSLPGASQRQVIEPYPGADARIQSITSPRPSVSIIEPSPDPDAQIQSTSSPRPGDLYEPTFLPSTDGLSTEAIIGLAVGFGLFVPIVAGILCFVVVKRRKRRSDTLENDVEGMETSLPVDDSAHQEANSSQHTHEEPSVQPFPRPSADST